MEDWCCTLPFLYVYCSLSQKADYFNILEALSCSFSPSLSPFITNIGNGKTTNCVKCQCIVDGERLAGRLMEGGVLSWEQLWRMLTERHATKVCWCCSKFWFCPVLCNKNCACSSKCKYLGVACGHTCDELLYIWLRKYITLEVLFLSCSDLIIFRVQCSVFLNM